MSERITPIADELLARLGDLGNSEYALRATMPISQDTWDDKEWAIEFIARSIRAHVDAACELLGELRKAAKDKPAAPPAGG